MDGTTAPLASTSVSSPALPSGYTLKRRLGSFRTDGSAHIITFFQFGDEFLWKTPVNNTAGSVTTTPVTVTLTVPTGVVVKGTFNGAGTLGSPGVRVVLFYSFQASTQAANTPSGNINVTWGSADSQGGGQFSLLTNTSEQIAVLADNTTTVIVATTGWTDYRGRLD